MKKLEIFPTPLHYFRIGDTESFLKCKHVLENINSSDSCYTTEDTLQSVYPFTELSEVILSHAKEVFDDFGLKRTNEKIVCMWANISKSYNRHNLHLHANSYYSAVLYFNCPKPNPGIIGFRDPRPGLLTTWWEYENPNRYYDRMVEIMPEEGLLIFFPSWLEHGVQDGEFSDNERRISLSCNIMPESNIESYTHKYNYQ